MIPALVIFLALLSCSRYTVSEEFYSEIISNSQGISNMYRWRPYNVFFVGDHFYMPLRYPSPKQLNNTVQPNDFYLYAQSLLNMMTFKFERERNCLLKFKVSGTYVFGLPEEELYLPKSSSHRGTPPPDLKIVDPYLWQFTREHPQAMVADIIVVLTGNLLTKYANTSYYDASYDRMCTNYKTVVLFDFPFSYGAYQDLFVALEQLIGGRNNGSLRTDCQRYRVNYKDALDGKEGRECYGTSSTCCMPSFFGVYDFRVEEFCRHHRHLYPDVLSPMNVASGGCGIRCKVYLGYSHGMEVRKFDGPPGVVCQNGSDLWEARHICPDFDANIATTDEPYLQYEEFQNVIYTAWRVDSFDASKKDDEICMTTDSNKRRYRYRY
ncbi:uncharacterized protein LOC135373647 [Ornithodoros turicata]|uniref:uncharacterized protein LOC135373647 n=1 Tax=Ornithodoros turicata TaxID=34597 RepID=UPI00313A0883